ncbi:MAG: hypothetical protein ACRCXT_03740 [Paraclostridium sp.]
MAGAILTTFSAIADLLIEKHNKNKKDSQRITSLSAEASKVTAQFPVVMSKNISSETMYLLAKALERKYAVQLKIVMDSNLMTKSNSVSDYLARFHSITGGVSVHDKSPANGWSVNADLRNPINANTGDVSNPLSGWSVHENLVTKALYHAEFTGFNEATSVPFEEEFNYHAIGENASRAANKQMTRTLKMARSDRPLFSDSDVKKANELQPTIISSKVLFKDDDGNSLEREFYIGVKTRVVPVDSSAMIANMYKGVQRDRTLFNFFRATTGEISLLRDFILMQNNIKDDVSKDSGLWNNLRKNKIKNNIKNLLNYKTGLIPNTTIVMSMTEVEYIKAEYKTDLMVPANITSIIKEYFLSGVVIVDESNDMIYAVDDSGNFDQTTFQSLSKEADKSSDLKSVISLMRSRN